MIEKRHLTCIGCPLGCPLELSIRDGQLCAISGNSCPRGEEYARQEFSDPRRTLCTTVSCPTGLWPRLPVKSTAALPKAEIRTAARVLHGIQVEAPVRLGQIILENVADTGIDVVATRSLPRKKTGNSSA